MRILVLHNGAVHEIRTKAGQCCDRRGMCQYRSNTGLHTRCLLFGKELREPDEGGGWSTVARRLPECLAAEAALTREVPK